MSIEFENDSVDVGVQKIEYYIDKDSSLKFLAPYIASSNFNGTIPIVDTMLTASFLKPGMTIAFNGGGIGDQYFPIVSIEFDDLDLTDSPTNLITIKYLDADSIVTSKEIDKSESVAVRYEDWDDKDLGSLGWSITSGGNAIFSNVGVRGRIEATEGEISGDLAIVEGGQIYVGNNKDSGQRINIRHTDLTGYSQLGFPTFSLYTGSATTSSAILKSGGFDDLVSGEDADPPWAAFWGFWPPIGSAATVDSTFYKHGGQSLRLYLIPGDYAVEQRAYGLIPGEEYTISAWVYSACALSVQKNELVDIWLLSASTTAGDRPNYFVSDTSLKSLIGATSVPAGVWTKLSNKFVVPAAPNIYHRIDLRTHVRSASFNVWWDSIEINKKSETSQISGFYFNDGELLTDYLKISSDGNLIVGPIKQNTVTSGTPDPTNITDILKISGTEQDYRLWVGHIDPLKSGFNITKTGHIKTGLITSSATYNRTDTTAYVSISSGGVLGRYSSTQRIKNNIIPINNLLSSNIDKNKISSEPTTINYKNILSLTPVEYSLIDYPEDKKFGFLAEDVADKLPEIATYDDNGPTYFDLAGLLAATLAIVQEQQISIENLENRVLQLESQLGG